MDLPTWRARMKRLYGTDHPEPAYMVWSGPGRIIGCSTLVRALEVVNQQGGVVYERLAASAIERLTEATEVEPKAEATLPESK